MGLIKSVNVPAAAASFSMRDIENHAKAILLRARQQAEALLLEAQREAETLKAAAHEEGMVEGRREGLAKGKHDGAKAGAAQALAEHKSQLTAAVNAVVAAATQLEGSRRDLEADGLKEVVALATAIARRVTKRQGMLDPAVLAENLNEAMKLVAHAADVRIALNPAQRKVLDETLPALRLAWPDLKHVELTEDPAIAPGGCRIFTARGQVDADLDAQLDRVVGDLLPSGTEGRHVKFLNAQLDAVDGSMPFGVAGQVQAVSGMTIEACDLTLPIGSLCRIHSFGGKTSTAEVIGFREHATLLMPLTPTAGVARGDRIVNLSAAPRIWCSEQLLGRVINGFGEPTDGKGPLRPSESRRIDGRAVRPNQRVHIDAPIATSVRAIDGLHTCGLGQRMGIFSGPGVGKSTLISSIAKHTSADVSVLALIGERGKEVNDFIEQSLGPEGLKRCVVIVATGDEAPLLRVRAAKVACTVAEYFRDRGKDVLLMMDSLTRMCQAQRQIGLAAREPPATKGFPPSVFALLPEILERAGKTEAGSITGFYTVLVEGDDFNEPIPDAVKGITDGHLWLSRSLANRGHFPAIDVLQSISRVRGDVTDPEQQRWARRVLALTAVYQDIEDLVNIGAYAPGVNADFDLAVQTRARVIDFLQQDSKAPSTFEQSKKKLADLMAWVDAAEKVLKAQAAAKASGRPAAR